MAWDDLVRLIGLEIQIVLMMSHCKSVFFKWAERPGMFWLHKLWISNSRNIELNLRQLIILIVRLRSYIVKEIILEQVLRNKFLLHVLELRIHLALALSGLVHTIRREIRTGLIQIWEGSPQLLKLDSQIGLLANILLLIRLIIILLGHFGSLARFNDMLDLWLDLRWEVSVPCVLRKGFQLL